MQPNLRGALYALAGFALYSTADAIIKVLGTGYNPVQIIAFAGLFTLPLIALWWLRAPVSLRPVHPWLMALRTLAIVGNGFAITYAFTVLPLAQVYAVAFTMPLLITLMAWPLLGDRVSLSGAIAILVGLAGVIVALQPGQVTPGLGHLTVSLGVALGAIHFIIIRKTGGVEATLTMLLYPVVGQTCIALVLLPGRYVPMPPADLALILGLTLAGFAGTLMLLAAYRTAPPMIVAPAQYSQIIWAAVLGALFFSEWMTLHTVMGMALIAAAGLMVIFRKENLPTGLSH